MNFLSSFFRSLSNWRSDRRYQTALPVCFDVLDIDRKTGGVLIREHQSHGSLKALTGEYLLSKRLAKMPVPPFVRTEDRPLTDDPCEEYGSRPCPQVALKDEIRDLVLRWFRGLKSPEVPSWLGTSRYSLGSRYGDHGGVDFQEKPLLRDGVTLGDIERWVKEVTSR